jgi:transcriptional regulator with XRE-family HTH domain
MSKAPVDIGDVDAQWAAFTALLKQRRREAKLSQATVAERADMSKSFLSQIEAGTANPSLVTILRLANAIDIDPADLFTAVKAQGEGGRG